MDDAASCSTHVNIQKVVVAELSVVSGENQLQLDYTFCQAVVWLGMLQYVSLDDQASAEHNYILKFPGKHLLLYIYIYIFFFDTNNYFIELSAHCFSLDYFWSIEWLKK